MPPEAEADQVTVSPVTTAILLAEQEALKTGKTATELEQLTVAVCEPETTVTLPVLLPEEEYERSTILPVPPAKGELPPQVYE